MYEVVILTKICRVEDRFVSMKEKRVYDLSTIQIEYYNGSSVRYVRCSGTAYPQNSANQYVGQYPFVHVGMQYRNACGKWSFE